jgi:hypothetical protein
VGGLAHGGPAPTTRRLRTARVRWPPIERTRARGPDGRKVRCRPAAPTRRRTPPVSLARLPPPDLESRGDDGARSGTVGRRAPRRRATPRRAGQTAPSAALFRAAPLVASLGIVAAAVALVAVCFSVNPVPPAIDPAHWLTDAYAWIGWPYPSASDVGSPYAYAPLPFPLLGLLVLATGRPLLAAFLYADLLVAALGLSTVHLALTPNTTGFDWASTGSVGQLPDPVTIHTSVTVSPAPVAGDTSYNASTPLVVSGTFENPRPASPLSVTVHLATPGASNPAVALPAFFDPAAFLRAHQIHFLVLPNTPGYLPTARMFEADYGYAVVYQNSAWLILQG